MDHFQQILKICPRFYLHKWETRNSGKSYDLIIDFPKNIREILADPNTQPLNDSLEGKMRTEILEQRKEEMELSLFLYLVSEYEAKKPDY